ncbi:MAG: GIY-YIG nuclease family protein, partial [Lewinella sp.]|nr:GIY-YIG nuclease family protein [Lewinella sp.]
MLYPNSKAMHFVYILYSEGSQIYYVGQTPDLSTRLLFHNELSEKSFTSRHRPWEL